MRQLKSFCVGHTLPLFEPHMPFEMLCPSPLGIGNELVIDDGRFGLSVDGASLAEYSQLFGLHDKLSSGDIVADDLFLFQYRKFISPFYGGAESVSPWIRVLTSDTVFGIFPSPDVLDTFATRLAVGSIFDFGESVAANYARVHVIDDLVVFAAACADSGALTQADIQSFVTMRGVIPSPAVCFIHADLFTKVMAILRKVWDCYHPHYQVQRSGYQRRVSGYLFERLHSSLLCKWLMDGSEPDVKLWHRYVVADVEKAV